MNLKTMETWLWGEVQLAAHEVVAAANFIENLAQNRTFVDVMGLVPAVAPFWGAVKLTADEIEKIKAFVGQMKAPVVEIDADMPPAGA
jgi:hypothetical protein